MYQVDHQRPNIAHAPLGYNDANSGNVVTGVPPPRALAGNGAISRNTGSPETEFNSSIVPRPGHLRVDSHPNARTMNSPSQENAVRTTSPMGDKGDVRLSGRFAGRNKNEVLSNFTRSSNTPQGVPSAIAQDGRSEQVDEDRRKSLDLADFWSTEQGGPHADSGRRDHTTRTSPFEEAETSHPQMGVFTPEEERPAPMFDAMTPAMTSSIQHSGGRGLESERGHDDTQSQYPDDEGSGNFLRFKRPSFLASPAPWRFGARSGTETAGSPVPSQGGVGRAYGHTPQHSTSEILFEQHDSPQDSNARSLGQRSTPDASVFPIPPAANKGNDRSSAFSTFFDMFRGKNNSDHKSQMTGGHGNLATGAGILGAAGALGGVRHLHKHSLSERTSLDGEDPMTPFYDAPTGRSRGMTTSSDPLQRGGKYQDDDIYHKGYGHNNGSLDDLSLVEHSTHPTKDSQMVGAHQHKKQWFFLPRRQGRKTGTAAEPVHEKYFDDDEDPETGKPRYGLPVAEATASRKRRSKIRNPICRCLSFLFFTALILAIGFLVICLIYFFAIFKWPAFTMGTVGAVSNVQLSSTGFNVTRIVDGTLSNQDLFEIDLRGFGVNAEYNRNGTYPFGSGSLAGVSDSSPLKLPKNTFVAVQLPLVFSYLVSQDDKNFTFLKALALDCGSDGSSADITALSAGQEGYLPFAISGAGQVKVLGITKGFSSSYNDVAMVCDPILARTVQQLLGYHGITDPNLEKATGASTTSASAAVANTGIAAFLSNAAGESTTSAAAAASSTSASVALGLADFLSSATAGSAALKASDTSAVAATESASSALSSSSSAAPTEPVGGIGIDAFLSNAQASTGTASSVATHAALAEFIKAASMPVSSSSVPTSTATSIHEIDAFLNNLGGAAATTSSAHAATATTHEIDAFLNNLGAASTTSSSAKVATATTHEIDAFLNNLGAAPTTANTAQAATATTHEIDAFLNNLGASSSTSAGAKAATTHEIDAFLNNLGAGASTSSAKTGATITHAIDAFLNNLQSAPTTAVKSQASAGGLDAFLNQMQNQSPSSSSKAQAGGVGLDAFLNQLQTASASTKASSAALGFDAFVNQLKATATGTGVAATGNAMGLDAFLNGLQASASSNPAAKSSAIAGVDEFLANLGKQSSGTNVSSTASAVGGLQGFLNQVKGFVTGAKSTSAAIGLDAFINQLQTHSPSAAAGSAATPTALGIEAFLAGAQSKASTTPSKNVLAAAKVAAVTSTAELAPAPASTSIGDFVAGLGSPASGGAQPPTSQLTQEQYDALSDDEKADYEETVENYNAAYEAQHSSSGSLALSPDQYASLSDSQKMFYNDLLKDSSTKTSSAAAIAASSVAVSTAAMAAASSYPEDFTNQFNKIFKGGLGSGASGGAIHSKRDVDDGLMHRLSHRIRDIISRRKDHKKPSTKVPVFSGGLGSPASGGAVAPVGIAF